MKLSHTFLLGLTALLSVVSADAFAAASPYPAGTQQSNQIRRREADPQPKVPVSTQHPSGGHQRQHPKDTSMRDAGKQQANKRNKGLQKQREGEKKELKQQEKQGKELKKQERALKKQEKMERKEMRMQKHQEHVNKQLGRRSAEPTWNSPLDGYAQHDA